MSSFRTVELSDPVFECMGLRFLTIKTKHLRGRGDICLYVPEVEHSTSGLPIYILLHGVYGSAWVWALKGGVHQTAKRLIADGHIKPAIIAMPSDGLWGDGSAYFTHHKKSFDKWIVHDVPLAIRENVAVAGSTSPLCISGLSMGGYGALSLGSKFPDRFTAISGHSSITRLEEMSLFAEEPLEEYTTSAKFPNVIDTIKMNRQKLPSLRLDCGRSDPLIEGNRVLHQQLLDADIDHDYAEFDGGHEWKYWGEHIEKTLLFFDSCILNSSPANTQY